MINPVENPNAAAAWQGTSLGVALVYVLGLVGIAIPAAPAAAIAGVIGVGLVYAGRRGLRSIPMRIWHGANYEDEKAAAPAKRRRTRSTSRGRR